MGGPNDLLGPVFVKEMLEVARRPGYYVARMLLGVIVLVVLGVILYESPRTYSIAMTAQVGHFMFLGWMWTQFLVLAAVTPTFVCGLIAGEKDKSTLEILFTTDLKNREIIVGKLASRWLLLLLMLVSSMPVVIILALFGGVNYRDMYLGVGLTVSVTAFIAALGMYFSLVTAKPWIAMLRTYMAGAILWLLLPMLSAWAIHLWMNGGQPPALFWFFLFLWHPLLDMALLTDGRGAPVPLMIDDMILLACGFWLLAASGLFTYCCLKLRAFNTLGTTPVLWRIAGRVVAEIRRRLTWPGERLPGWRTLCRVATDARRRWGERLLDFNPMLFRNDRGDAYDGEHHLLVMQFVGMIALIIFFAMQSTISGGRLQSSWAFTPALTAMMLAIHLVLVVLAAGSVAREAERGTLEQLMLTSIAPAQVVTGHFLGVLKTLKPSFCALAATIAFGMVTGALSGNGRFLCLYVGVLISMTLMVTAEGLLLSCVCPTVALASSRALVAPGLQWFLGLFMKDFSVHALERLALVETVVILLAFRGLKGDANYRRLSALLIAWLLPCVLFHGVVLFRTTTPVLRLSQGFNLASWVSDITNDVGPYRLNVPPTRRGPQWQGPFEYEAHAPMLIGLQLASTVVLLWLAAWCLPQLIGPGSAPAPGESRRWPGRWRWRFQRAPTTTSAGWRSPAPAAPLNPAASGTNKSA